MNSDSTNSSQDSDSDITRAAQALMDVFARIQKLDPEQRKRVIADLAPQTKELVALVNEVLDEQRAA